MVGWTPHSSEICSLATPVTAYLRQWFGHDPGKWEEFKKRYKAELDHSSEAVAQLKEYMAKGTVTFVYGAKDQEHNDAVVLQEYVEKRE